MRNTLEISGILFAILLSAMAFTAWLTEHDDRLRRKATLATQKQALDAANLREQDRASTLKDSLAQIAALKRQTQTPAQILSALPKFLALPQPITPASPQGAALLTQQGTVQQGTARSENSPYAAKGCAQPAPSSSSTTPTNSAPGLEFPATATPANSQDHPDAPTAQIPATDPKPLFDFVRDCRSCQAQLAAAKQDSTDNGAKLAAVTKERDAAVAAVKGGTFRQRLHRNALWFVVGAADGSVALCGTGHCR